MATVTYALLHWRLGWADPATMTKAQGCLFREKPLWDQLRLIQSHEQGLEKLTMIFLISFSSLSLPPRLTVFYSSFWFPLSTSQYTYSASEDTVIWISISTVCLFFSFNTLFIWWDYFSWQSFTIVTLFVCAVCFFANWEKQHSHVYAYKLLVRGRCRFSIDGSTWASLKF